MIGVAPLEFATYLVAHRVIHCTFHLVSDDLPCVDADAPSRFRSLPGVVSPLTADVVRGSIAHDSRSRRSCPPRRRARARGSRRGSARPVAPPVSGVPVARAVVPGGRCAGAEAGGVGVKRKIMVCSGQTIWGLFSGVKHVPGPRPTLPRKRRRKAVCRPIRSTARLLTVAGFGERSSLRRLELSNEDDRRIRRALNDAGAGGGDTFIGDRRTVEDSRGASVVFTPDAALSLRPSELVTAGAIDVWMALVVNRAGPGWRAMSSCFYDRLVKDGQFVYGDTVRSDRVGVATNDVTFVPVHSPGHWSLVVIDNGNRRLEFYDSLGRGGRDVLRHIEKLVHAEEEVVGLPRTTWDPVPCVPRDPDQCSVRRNALVSRGVPQQGGEPDCGVMVCYAADHIAAGDPLDYDLHDMAYGRRRMLLRCLEGELEWGADRDWGCVGGALRVEFFDDSDSDDGGAGMGGEMGEDERRALDGVLGSSQRDRAALNHEHVANMERIDAMGPDVLVDDVLGDGDLLGGDRVVGGEEDAYDSDFVVS